MSIIPLSVHYKSTYFYDKLLRSEYQKSMTVIFSVLISYRFDLLNDIFYWNVLKIKTSNLIPKFHKKKDELR